MNIWILTTEYPPEGGGIGTYVFNAARMFAEGGHKVTILQAGKQAETQVDRKIRLVKFATGSQLLAESESAWSEPDKHAAFPYNEMDYWPALSYQFAEEVRSLTPKLGQPDLIEVQDYGAVGYYLLIRQLLQEEPFAKIPIVLHLHSPFFEVARINQMPRYKLPGYWLGQM